MVAHTLCPHITPKPGSQATSERYAHTGASHRALRMLLQPTALIWVPEQCSGSMLRLHLAHACCNSHICTPYTRMCFCLMGQISAPRSHLAQRKLAAMQSTCKTDPRVSSSGCAVHVQGAIIPRKACWSGANFIMCRCRSFALQHVNDQKESFVCIGTTFNRFYTKIGP